MVFRRAMTTNPIAQLREEMDRLVNSVMDSPAVAGATRMVTGRGFPAINVWENGDNVYVEAEVPGLKSEHLEISVVGDELTLKGSRSAVDNESAAYHRRERGLGGFTRVVRLPSAVESNSVEAALSDGVLRLTLPKAEAAKPRKIHVRTAG